MCGFGFRRSRAAEAPLSGGIRSSADWNAALSKSGQWIGRNTNSA